MNNNHSTWMVEVANADEAADALGGKMEVLRLAASLMVYATKKGLLTTEIMEANASIVSEKALNELHFTGYDNALDANEDAVLKMVRLIKARRSEVLGK